MLKRIVLIQTYAQKNRHIEMVLFQCTHNIRFGWEKKSLIWRALINSLSFKTEFLRKQKGKRLKHSIGAD